MQIDQYLAEAEAVEREGTTALTEASDLDALEAARVSFLGDRQGRVKALQEALKSISKDEKPAAGKRFNEARTRLQALHDERKTTLGRAHHAGAKDDLSPPERRVWKGAKHPVTLVI